jgi:MFS family permease
MLYSGEVHSISRKNAVYDYTSSCMNGLLYAFAYQFYIPVAIQNGAANWQIGLLSAAPAAGVLLAPLWASLQLGKAPKPFVILSNLLGRLSFLLPAVWGTPWSYVCTLFFFHLMMGIQSPAYASLMTRIYPPEVRGERMGKARMMMCFAMIPISPLLGYWLDLQGSAPPLIWSAITGSLSIGVLAFVKDYDPRFSLSKSTLPPSFFSQLRFVQSNPLLLVFFVATSLCGINYILASPLYSIIQVEHLQLTNLQISQSKVIYFIVLLLSYYATGRIIDRYSPGQTLIFAMVGFMTGPLLYIFFPGYGGVLTANAIYGAADAAWELSILSFIFRMAPGREAVVYSIHLLLFGIRGTIAPIIGTSLVSSMPMTQILCISTACGLLGLLLFIRLFVVKRKAFAPLRMSNRAV